MSPGLLESVLAYARLMGIERRGGRGGALVPYGAFMTGPSAPQAGRDRVALPRTTLGPFLLTDATRSELITAVVTAAVGHTAREAEEPRQTHPPTVMLSLHVGGLNARKNAEFIAALNRADLLVADGISVAALATLAGASGLHRHPTTDLGWELLSAIAQRLGRPVKVALLGGPDGLARRAGEVLAAHPEHSDIEVSFVEHGYHADWSAPLEKLAKTDWDVLFVGMGMPTEALWVDRHRTRLNGALVLTCGGWFGHIVGDEQRAPAWMRRAGLEWAARLAQQPTRLAGRYAKGLLSAAAMVPTALRSRWTRGHRREQHDGNSKFRREV